MADARQQAAKEFADYWKGKGYEKGDSQSFWLALLRDVYGVKEPEKIIEFEDQVHIDNTSFIDGMISSTRVMIEQKSLGKDLGKAIKQSDGSFLTPFQQAKRYAMELPVDRHPRYVVTCNFSEFWVYDMNKPGGDPAKIQLADLPDEYYRLAFLVESKSDHLKREEKISEKAGDIVGMLYDAFAKQYGEADRNSEYVRHSLNVLCVRLVFCLYAENSGIFGYYGMFRDYMEMFETQQMRKALEDLFDILDKPSEKRPRHLADDNPKLAAFPYVNGGLFAEVDVDIPPFTDEIRSLLLEEASAGFNWSEISPTIFGAVFESTLNPATRRAGGMHYTSVENIHKVIDPLFLDGLKKEFSDICEIDIERTRNKRLEEFQKKLASLTFLDPACGSGNFLTESYLSLRRLENDVLRSLQHGQMSFGLEGIDPIQISLRQFYGIEINDFAVSVAMTALWIAESQMMQETESIVMRQLSFLPLESYTNIVEGNALRKDWNEVVPKEQLDYIMGNPPFVGTKYQSQSQKEDILSIDNRLKPLDYVTGWFKKASDFISNTEIKCAFVATNSITQGEQVAPLWQCLNVQIIFAYRTFKWSSESNEKAQVHCVIIGFISQNVRVKEKYLYDGDNVKIAQNINGYLIDAPDVSIEMRRAPLCPDAPKMIKGSQPTDGGYLLLNEDERQAMILKDPKTEKYIRRYMGATDLINGSVRYCLWLVDCPPNELRSMPEIMERIKLVRQSRLSSKKKATQKWADRPQLFTENRQPDKNYLILPVVSSEKRRYMPICYVTKDVIANANAQMIPNANLYTFGIISSNVHNSWLRTVCGRMKSDYAYSATIVYNNFPWPCSTEAQHGRIEQTAQAILDARALYPDSSLADLYDELTMPPELRNAHQKNDKAVMEAYGFTKGTEAYSSEDACVAELMKMYQKLTSKS